MAGYLWHTVVRFKPGTDIMGIGLKEKTFAVLRFILGKGWTYHFPLYYQRIMKKRFDSARQEAFRYFIEKAGVDLREKRTCLDLGCGTGITSVWLAGSLSPLFVIGVDRNRAMLKRARRQAKKLGVADRCMFLEGDAHHFTRADFCKAHPAGNGLTDVVVSAFGFSVMADPASVFKNTLHLLKDDGYYIIFDQYIPGLVLPDFAADQSRKSWELVESCFVAAETKWFGNIFIAIGHGKNPAAG